MAWWLLQMLLAQKAHAVVVGSVHCQAQDDSRRAVEAELEAARETPVNFAQSAHIRLTSRDAKGLVKILREWREVPRASGPCYLMVFAPANAKPRFEFWFDDVTANSSLSFDGQLLRLKCDVQKAQVPDRVTVPDSRTTCGAD